ncbi:integrase [Halobacteriales archaeon QS_1_68_20]|nr:MAG: integrase [Halobacteriales archaeon QS_1_68_20]
MSAGASEEAVEDPVEYFLRDQEFHGRSDRTLDSYRRVLRDFESFLADSERNPAGESMKPDEAGQRECMAWVHELRGEVAESTVATYAAYLHRFYAYMTQVGTFDANPMALVTEEMDERIESDPTRREVSVEQMQSFVDAIARPLDRALVVTLLKTGMRVGELCNLDLRDLRFDHPAGDELDAGGRPQLGERSDSLFVSATPERGEVINGKERPASNKRKRDTIVPVDDELRRVLVKWLAVRPDPTSPADPLFVNTRERWGRRIEPSGVRYIVEQHAREFGWYRTGGGSEENVTPHYFRHFFTTHLRDATGDRGIVKYLRGDVAEDVIDTYTHNWGDRVREVYEANVYSLL